MIYLKYSLIFLWNCPTLLRKLAAVLKRFGFVGLGEIFDAILQFTASETKNAQTTPTEQKRLLARILDRVRARPGDTPQS